MVETKLTETEPNSAWMDCSDTSVDCGQTWTDGCVNESRKLIKSTRRGDPSKFHR